MANFSGRNLIILTVGGIVAYSAVKGNSISASVRNFIKGGSPNQSSQTAPIDSGSVSGSDMAATPNLGNTAATNRAMGRLMAASYGWGTGNEWVALDNLWTRESGWSNVADNPSSHAYGIPQALPSSKLPKAGQPAAAGGSSSSTAQIAWGLEYIRTTYGDPVSAWQHETQFGWY